MGGHLYHYRQTDQSKLELHLHTEELHVPYHNEQEMGLVTECAVGHLTSFWQQLQHRAPYKPDSIHEQSEEGEVEAEAMQGLEVLLSLPDTDPMLHDPQVSSQNETLTY